MVELVALVITWETIADVLVTYLLSPLYVTAINLVLTPNVLIENEAVPPLSATFPRTAAPDLKLIVPVGVPVLELSTTVAVKVTFCP